ncbi:MAG: sugar phosphate isomerase/epimerase [Chloroflexota bacterium]|nr:sugar phosphate isomerase/epimerase [Chloroflexota bacterium]
MWKLSAFADEIGPELDTQLTTLARESIKHIDLRGVWDKNVLALTDDEVRRVASDLANHGIQVATIASPIGKIGIGDAFAPHLAEFRRALDIARAFNAPVIRIFSFFMPVGDDPARHRDEVLRRLEALVAEADGSSVLLLHENEKDIYGDTPERCHDLLTSINSPILRAVWDPANFVQVGIRPFSDGYALLRPFIAAVHVKDAVAGTGQVVLPGAGDGQIPETLVALHASGFAGVFSLEPHLATVGTFAGTSGPVLFRHAATSFKTLLRERGIAWR